MRKLIISMFMALDGVVENPMWSMAYWNDEIAKFKHAELFAADALLLGRVTYEGFAQAWPQRKGSDDYADRFNSMKKYAVSTTMQSASWENSQIISENILETIAKLKQQDGMDIIVFGSVKLCHALLRANLLDQFNIIQYPIIIGKGQTLFGGYGEEYKLKMTKSQLFDTGAMALVMSKQTA
jgi:dihydrofolate reductase